MWLDVSFLFFLLFQNYFASPTWQNKMIADVCFCTRNLMASLAPLELVFESTGLNLWRAIYLIDFYMMSLMSSEARNGWERSLFLCSKWNALLCKSCAQVVKVSRLTLMSVLWGKSFVFVLVRDRWGQPQQIKVTSNRGDPLYEEIHSRWKRRAVKCVVLRSNAVHEKRLGLIIRKAI